MPSARSLLAAATLAVALASNGPALAVNRLANPEFDSGLSGWRVDFPRVHFAGADSGFDPDSGSLQVDLQIADPDGAAFTGRQCVPVDAGATYQAAVRAALLGPDHPRSRLFLEVVWHAQADCADPPIAAERLVEADDRYQFWLLLATSTTAPEGAAAASFTVGSEKLEPGGDFPVYALFDRAFFADAAESLAAGSANRVTNGDFATSTSGWTHDADVVFSAVDASGDPASGSLEIRNDDDSPIGDESATQCFAIEPGTYAFSARFQLLDETPPGTADVELRLFSAADCADSSQVDNRVLATGTQRQTWGTLQANGVAIPDGVQSARLKLETLKTGSGTLVGRYDDVFFGVAGGGATCVADATTLCLRGGRFRVTAGWVTGLGTSGPAFAVPLTADTGYFWFFDAANVEVVVKVLDGCGVTDHFWVYAGGLTDLGITMTVTDVERDVAKTYQNVLGTPWTTLTDVQALDSCP
jgi:hypothetical protein